MAESMNISMYEDEENYTPEENLANLIRFSQPTSRPIRERTFCRFHQQGRCRFGNSCWNIHIDPERTITLNVRASYGGDDLRPPRRHREHNPMEDNNRYRDTNCEANNAFGSQGSSNLKSHRFDLRNHAASSHQECVPHVTSHLGNSSASAKRFSQCNPLPGTAARNDLQQELTSSNPPNWINAPEFIPKPRSYAEILKSNTEAVNAGNEKIKNELCCSYYESGECPFPSNCPYVHGDLCEICQKNSLHPYDEAQRKLHTEQCVKELEQDMELSFAVQRSQDKACGICMDIVLEKEPKSERRFGILEKCSHVFCLGCIRKWRKSKSFDTSNHLENALDPVVTRGCPECRVASDFITPSQYWIDTEDEKKKLIDDYKVALSKKPCKYFKQGKGNCPFGGACFYLHAKPDGTPVELPPPVRRRRQNQDGELDFMGRIYLLDYLELRDENFLMQLGLDDYIYAMSDMSDTDTSEASDNFFLSETF